ncbi:MAG: ABC-F family ATP-binding cassette domain-containing protein [Chitinophagales bacterium]|nr:ABC-F family ATP-binding cassette domain-containing protein [Chitinophagales bacterium]MDW8393707.1 ABC-F family ATP-binding cassette domain-containing protein [Chitinophagales bacterium]
MLIVDEVGVRIGGDDLFRKVSFVVNAGERIGLIGRNGSGKTTLLRLLAGRQQPDEGQITLARGRRIGYLPQELAFQASRSVLEEAEEAFADIKQQQEHLQRLTAQMAAATDTSSAHYMRILEEFQALSDHLQNLGVDKLPQQLEKILLGLGFQRSDFSRPASELSGGWQMRILLARLLLQQPDLLLLDEPTNHLDLDSIIWLEQFLERYSGAVILVSHDQTFLDRITTRTLELFNRRLLDFPCPFSEYVSLREEHQQHLLARKKNQERQIAHTQQLIDRFRYKATKARFAQSLIKKLERLPRIEVETEAPTIRFTFPEAPHSGRLVFEAQQLAIGYGRKPLASGLSFEILRQQRIAIVGRNGEGKTTLGRMLAGELKPLQGTLRNGHNLSIGYYAQLQADRLNGDDTVYETLQRIAPPDLEPRLRSLLGAFLFQGDAIYKKTNVLSGGEKSRLALAALLLRPYNVLILDEPTNHLDLASKAVLHEALRDFTGTLIVVSHDRSFLDGLVNTVFYLHHGKLEVYPGTISEFLERRQLNTLQQLEQPTSRRGAPAKPPALPAADIKKLQRQIQAAEKRITQLEQLLAELEQRFAAPDAALASDTELFTRYQQTREQRDQAFSQWAELQHQLEAAQGSR